MIFSEMQFQSQPLKFKVPLLLKCSFLEDFIENALFKEDFKDFEIPENIYLTTLNYNTGLKSASGEKNSIIEALKLRDINNLNNNNLISTTGNDKLIKFRQFY